VKRNPGHLPSEAIGKRVRVKLEHVGKGATDPNPMSPLGWAADGKGGCNWRRSGNPFDIAEYEVIQ